MAKLIVLRLFIVISNILPVLQRLFCRFTHFPAQNLHSMAWAILPWQNTITNTHTNCRQHQTNSPETAGETVHRRRCALLSVSTTTFVLSLTQWRALLKLDDTAFSVPSLTVVSWLSALSQACLPYTKVMKAIWAHNVSAIKDDADFHILPSPDCTQNFSTRIT